jgi:hypothetical protein
MNQRARMNIEIMAKGKKEIVRATSVSIFSLEISITHET